MLPALALLCVIGCKKEPGSGGDALITGVVMARDYNSTFTSVIGEYPASDEYVYIVYGDHPGYDKRIKTDYNGAFQFEFLYEGKYTIYAYSADSTLSELDGTVPVIRSIEITERKQKFDAGIITILK